MTHNGKGGTIIGNVIRMQSADARVERALAALPRPDVPDQLIARIVRDVPRLPQHPATPAAVGVQDHGLAHVADVQRPGRRHWLAWGGGSMAGIAAGVAALMLSGPYDVPDALDGGAAPARPPQMQQSVADSAFTAPRISPSDASRLAQTGPVGHIAAARGLVPTHRAIVAAVAPAAVTPVAVTPAATAAPMAPAPGAMSSPAPLPADLAQGDGSPFGPLASPEDAAPARGPMGPFLPQGFGFTGGGAAGGPSIPAGSPVTMSGGPGSH